ncbi:hypothetical protein ABIA25_005654 [Sinorhizobium fredii]
MEPSPPLPHSLGARGPCQPGATGMANIVVFPFLIMAIEAAVERLTCPARLTLPTSRKGLPMSSLTLCDIAKKLKKIDFCMMATRASSGAIANRPMSNNGDVEYDGDSWFFSFEETHKVSEIIRDPQVALAFAEPAQPPGQARDLHLDRGRCDPHSRQGAVSRALGRRSGALVCAGRRDTGSCPDQGPWRPHSILGRRGQRRHTRLRLNENPDR